MQLKAIDNMVIILVDRVEYAIIENVMSVHELDWNKIANWVNETCYNDDHLCDAYIPPYLKYSEFTLD